MMNTDSLWRSNLYTPSTTLQRTVLSTITMNRVMMLEWRRRGNNLESEKRPVEGQGRNH